MKSFESEIVIKATAAEVWQVLTSFSAYKEWNPFLTHLKGSATSGAMLHVKAQLSHLPAISFTATLSTFKPLHCLGWNATFAGGLFRAYHFFRIEPQASDTCRLVHGEEFRGLLALPLLLLLAPKFQAGYAAMNEALKRHVESQRDDG